ncbi:MAG: carbohydrate binding domain-containing protein, partial [Armatimonadota bacterium]|nr:carbohydrate binding domain-containing protein [Armatimonadota bacterium]
MRRVATIAALLVLTTAAWGQRPLRHVLFDFEGGVDDWLVNVWGGGGEVELSVAEEPKFGSGALHSEATGVEKGGNSISPWLPEDAEWRQHEWGKLSLWFRGDGSPTRASLRVQTGVGEEIDQSYSLNLPMDSTRWRRISAPVGAFWNRDRVPMDTRRIVRLYIGTSGTHRFEVDQIALDAEQRP